MGNHLCIKGVSGKFDGERVGAGGGSATPNGQHPPPSVSPSSLPEEADGDVIRSAHSPALPSLSPFPAGTPRRRSRWPFRLPSPAEKPSMPALLRRLQGAPPAASSQSPIPSGNNGREITLGYSGNFPSLFEVGKELGRGHFGHTCKGKGLSGELKKQHVAIKIISKARMTKDLSIDDVRREVSILRALSSHRNLIQFYEAFEDQQNVYIVTEYCEGGELLDRMLSRGGKFKEEDAKRVVVQILNVVAHMHLQGVVHRDLKPENFLFARKNEEAPLKVIDFGLSDFIQPDERLNDIVGSAFYMAPEVLHRSHTVSADMWSVGVITYLLLCGSRPFWGLNDSRIFQSVLHTEPNIQDGPWRNISTEAKDFVRRLLVKDHRMRMSAAQALTHPWLRSQNPTVPLDILVFKLVRSYVRFRPLRCAALQALSMALTEEELLYLRAQFELLEPIDGYVSFDNFRVALMKNMSNAMRESSVLDILHRMMRQIPYEEIDFGQFCAAAINPLQLETLQNWEQMVTRAYVYFEQWNREITIEEIAEEENLGPLIPSIVRQWVRSDGKLTFLGYKRILHGTSIFHSFGSTHRRRAAGRMVTEAAATSSAT